MAQPRVIEGDEFLDTLANAGIIPARTSKVTIFAQRGKEVEISVRFQATDIFIQPSLWAEMVEGK